MENIDVEELRRLIQYDSETGILSWKESRRGCKKGKKIGTIYPNGYFYIRYKNKIYLSHRLIWFYVYGEWPNVIDHINGNRYDNRLCNLRSVTFLENLQNMKCHREGKLPGAEWYGRGRSKPWRVRVTINGKKKYIGYCATEQEASDLYLKTTRAMIEAAEGVKS